MSTKTVATAAAESTDALLADLRALLAEAENLASHTVPDQARDRLDDLRDRLEAAQDRLADYYAMAKDRVSAGARRTDETIRSHPYESIAIALGVGVLLGVLLKSKR